MIEFDFEKMLRNSERQAASAREMERRAAELVGRARTDDGRVAVEWTQDGLTGLELDPRAMRMSSAELAETIIATGKLAKQDLRSQSDALADEIFGPEGNPMDMVRDPEAIQAKIEDIQAVFDGTLQDTNRLLDQVRRDLGR